jgi:beta-N-acetylhexosaminidase
MIDFPPYHIEKMTLEEKVGQLLVVSFRGEEANEEARVLIQEVKVGGIVYYTWANGLHSPEQVKALSAGLQQLAEIPLFIAADQEGGVVSRFQSGFTTFPGNGALGETGEPALAYDAALAVGQEMRSVGVNMNFAPVVDVNCNPRNPVIGVRSFGSDAETVCAFGAEALRGYRDAEVIATLKHYPGHGDTDVDSHEKLPVVHKSLEELERVELLPFLRLASVADAIMTAHILLPALDAENCATLSAKSLKTLRENFQGVIVSDSLVMGGVIEKSGTVDEAAIAALSAGCDLLVLGGRLLEGERAGFELTAHDIQRVANSLALAVREGRIPEERLNDAAARILSLKNRCVDVGGEIDWEGHRATAKKIASRALKVIENGVEALMPLSEKRIAIVAPEVLQKTTLLSIGKLDDIIESADVLLVFSYNAWKDPVEIARIQSLLDLGKPTILIVARDPVDATLFPRANLILMTFSPTEPAIQAALDSIVHNLCAE